MTLKEYNFPSSTIVVDDEPKKPVLSTLSPDNPTALHSMIGGVNQRSAAIISLTGRIDYEPAPELEQILLDLTNRQITSLIVNMRDVTFISSVGWWALVKGAQKVRRHKRGQLVLVDVPEANRTTLNLMGMGEYFPIVKSKTSE